MVGHPWIPRHEQLVAAGPHGLDRDLGRGAALQHAGHLQRVGDHHTLVAEPVPEQAGDDHG
jgi:hypothetical protein